MRILSEVKTITNKIHYKKSVKHKRKKVQKRITPIKLRCEYVVDIAEDVLKTCKNKVLHHHYYCDFHHKQIADERNEKY